MERPLQLIELDPKTKKYKLVKNVLKIIESETRAITLVAIVGPARTGKSHLLNRLAGDSSKILFIVRAIQKRLDLLFTCELTACQY